MIKTFVDTWTHGFEALARHVEAYTPEKMATVTWVPADQIRGRGKGLCRCASSGNPMGQPHRTT